LTGGGSGIGRALAKHLADEGAAVVCVDKNKERVQETAAQINASSPMQDARYIEADITVWDDVTRMFQTAEQMLSSKLDVVFANAGTALMGFPNAEGAPNLHTINVNLSGTIYTLQAAINHFRSHKSGGQVIVTASQASIHPIGGEPLYTASKFGVLGLVRATAMQMEAEGIYINAVAPGSTSSNLMPKDVEEALNAEGWKVPMEKVLEAFDLLLKPGSKHSGQCVEAVGDHVAFCQYTLPSMSISYHHRIDDC
ncbi:NAD-binding protein, partial [Fomitopsis schrenkii]